MDGFLLSDAELHGLIDGQIEVHHRADILRRAAASQADRERIGNWQSQCELIRSAFRGIEREPLPSSLDLRPPARVHGMVAPRGAQRLDDPPPIVAAGPRRGRLILPSLAALVAAAGLAATWLAGGFWTGLPEPALTDASADRRPEMRAIPVVSSPAAMPTATIPDLTTLGYALTSAEMRDGDPASMLFHYRDGAAREITLAVSRSDAPSSGIETRPVASGGSWLWRAGPRAYVLAGDIQPDRLRVLAPAVRDLAVEE